MIGFDENRKQYIIPLSLGQSINNLLFEIQNTNKACSSKRWLSLSETSQVSHQTGNLCRIARAFICACKFLRVQMSTNSIGSDLTA